MCETVTWAAQNFSVVIENLLSGYREFALAGFLKQKGMEGP